MADDELLHASDQLANLVATMISFLEPASERTLGGRWRDQAEVALRRYRAAKKDARQGSLFDHESMSK